MTSWDLLYHILRANFDGLESDYCAAPEKDGNWSRDGTERLMTYENGKKVVGLKEVEEGQVEVEFEDEEGAHATMKADHVLAADGASSTIRDLMLGSGAVKRKYAGYVAFRGTIREDEASVKVKEAFCETFTFFHAKGTQILS
jgi:2-polyprenyl-6-methoxyphenol hydroxylase-like FAD-dependent oxidoreductase